MRKKDRQIEKLIKHYEDKRRSMKRRYNQEEVEMDKDFYAELNRLIEKYTPKPRLELEEATPPPPPVDGVPQQFPNMAATSLSAASLSDSYRDGAVFMICQNIAGPYTYEIYSIDFKRVREGSYGSSPRSIPYPVKQLEREVYPICMGFFSIGSKIYMIGGVKIRSGQTTSRVYVYNTITNSVTRGPSMLKPKVAPFVLGSDPEGNVYVHGAGLQDHDFERFEPESQKWSKLPHAPVPSKKEAAGDRGRGPPPKYDIAASAVVDHTILLWTFNDHMFSFNIITNTWSTVDKGSGKPFVGQAVLADGHFYAPVQNRLPSDEFPLYAFYFKPHLYEFVKEAPVENLPRPAGDISSECRGHVAYLGNHHLCVVRSGYDGPPYTYEYIPPKHYVTIDLFRVESRCIRGVGVKSRCFFAVDHHSLSYIMDDSHPEDFARMICFAAATPTPTPM